MERAYRRKMRKDDEWPVDDEGPLELELTRENVDDLLQRWERYAAQEATDDWLQSRMKAIDDEHDALVSAWCCTAPTLACGRDPTIHACRWLSCRTARFAQSLPIWKPWFDTRTRRGTCCCLCA